MKKLFIAFLFMLAPSCASAEIFIGFLNTDEYDPLSVNNPYGIYGDPYSPLSIHNPYGRYGDPIAIIQFPILMPLWRRAYMTNMATIWADSVQILMIPNQ